MLALRVVDWHKLYENNRSREIKDLAWVPVPNKHDGDGFTELMHHENGMAHLGAWLIILQVASRCSPRGVLVRANGRPHDAASLARIGHAQEALMTEAIRRLVADIGWLEEVDLQGVGDVPQSPAALPHLPAVTPQPPANSSARTEQNRKEQEAAAAKSRTVETPPPPLTPDEKAAAERLRAAMESRGGTWPLPDAELVRTVLAACDSVEQLDGVLAEYCLRRRPPDGWGFWRGYVREEVAKRRRAAMSRENAPPTTRPKPTRCAGCDGRGWVGPVDLAEGLMGTLGGVKTALAAGAELCGECSTGALWADLISDSLPPHSVERPLERLVV